MQADYSPTARAFAPASPPQIIRSKPGPAIRWRSPSRAARWFPATPHRAAAGARSDPRGAAYYIPPPPPRRRGGPPAPRRPRRTSRPRGRVRRVVLPAAPRAPRLAARPVRPAPLHVPGTSGGAFCRPPAGRPPPPPSRLDAAAGAAGTRPSPAFGRARHIAHGAGRLCRRFGAVAAPRPAAPGMSGPVSVRAAPASGRAGPARLWLSVFWFLSQRRVLGETPLYDLK